MTTTIIFGEVFGPDDRRDLEQQKVGAEHAVLWRSEPSLEGIGGKAATILVDLDTPQFCDPDFLVSLATAGGDTRVIGKAAVPAQQEALRLSKLGISEILSPDQCLRRIKQVLDQAAAAVKPPAPANSRYSVQALIGGSPQMVEVRKTIDLLAEVDFPSALILGPTGTGKGLIAKILHHHGLRRDQNLVEVNCSAIPDALFESELFGHSKGAFTDAKEDKRGLFEFADKGTIFLDEIGNLSPSAQAKLLKILEDKKLRRIGDINERDVDVRVVAATNLDLNKAVAAGTFREDLYFRLNFLTIDLPPLSERPGDIADILKHYLDFYAKLYGKGAVTMNPDAVEAMTGHTWRGNVRELCNVVERLVLLAQARTLTVADIDTALARGRIQAAERGSIVIDIPPQGITLAQVEGEVVKQVLSMCGWNKSQAARYLNISRARLRRIIETLGLVRNRRL